jgi:cytochrome c peroxidase
MGNRNLTVPLFGFLAFGALLSASKPQVGASISGEAELPSDLGGKMPPSFDQDVARVVDDIDRIEADTLSQMEHTALDRQGQVRTLGKLLLFDKHLSVNQNEACSFCHTPDTGFTGPIQSLNLTTVSYLGSVRTRFSNRKPQSRELVCAVHALSHLGFDGQLMGHWDLARFPSLETMPERRSL